MKNDNAVRIPKRAVECGGKRSATPLSAIPTFSKTPLADCFFALLIFFFAPFIQATETTADWHPADAPLKTRWAAQVNPANAHPEYPRPQLVRTDWTNLNGLWDYAITPASNNAPEHFDGKILVPFPLESSLSGVGKHLEEHSALWYRRTISVPPAWKGRHVRLQFGAVDWECVVRVNGIEVGQHRGGFDRFAFDITDALQWHGGDEILISVTDPTEGDQPRGKQSHKPEGIFYTASSGIWQTVWLEPVSEVSIDELQMTPDLDGQRLSLRAGVNSLADDISVEAIAREDGREVGRVSGPANSELFLPLKKVRTWSPDAPFLYDLELKVKKGIQEVDHVSSYFGMRKVALMPDKQGYTGIGLNNQSLFQIGTLDQGFWPEGIYTAPTDEAMRHDLEFLKQSGFNLTRKHVKVEPDRWYYWCDKLGLLVWQDMPSGNNVTSGGQREFESELQHMVKDLHDHPSIIVWVLFNEGWGQYDTQRLTQTLKNLDPSRLVDSASGWTDLHVGDIVDSHNYPGPTAPQSEPRRATALGEFGGLGLTVSNNSWTPKRHWGYTKEKDVESLATGYTRLLRQISIMHDVRGLSAAVYTQTTDVETECNGLLTYDREVAKLDPALLAQANATLQHRALNQVIAADATVGRPIWRYTIQQPTDDWFAPHFDTANWKEGEAGFGTDRTPGALVKTVWNTEDIWLRREFTLEKTDLPGLRLEAHHDEDAEVYINGVLAARLPGFITQYDYFDLVPDAIATLKPGTNTLAVHCHQTSGGQYIDVGLVIPATEASVTATLK